MNTVKHDIYTKQIPPKNLSNQLMHGNKKREGLDGDAAAVVDRFGFVDDAVQPLEGSAIGSHK
jgi:hypothetical protein